MREEHGEEGQEGQRAREKMRMRRKHATVGRKGSIIKKEVNCCHEGPGPARTRTVGMHPTKQGCYSQSDRLLRTTLLSATSEQQKMRARLQFGWKLFMQAACCRAGVEGAGSWRLARVTGSPSYSLPSYTSSPAAANMMAIDNLTSSNGGREAGGCDTHHQGGTASGVTARLCRRHGTGASRHPATVSVRDTRFASLRFASLPSSSDQSSPNPREIDTTMDILRCAYPIPTAETYTPFNSCPVLI
jgi:hypothetical protein